MRIINRPIIGLAASAALSACVPGPAREPALPTAPEVSPPVSPSYLGLEAVMGRDARALERAFGTPELDIHEGTARKLQFSSDVCILDAYLYPRGGRGDPVVTHVDARRPDGTDFDRASCVSALGKAR
ncbi:hypothetical protein [Allosphingosinicella vermicomposti]|uniref:hypothetical protein n=1 Tax=Allosphingosinicella vermicomposti TaxID=614671 RepID=UPI001FE1237B|nr:hypothetical protein [Allosphingosinicella vermicomposti]